MEQDQLPYGATGTSNCKRRKLARFEHVTRHDSLSKTILQGTLGGWRCRGRHRKCWMDNIKEWTSLPMAELFTGAPCRRYWKRISADRPSCPAKTQSVKGLNRTVAARSPLLQTVFCRHPFPYLVFAVSVGSSCPSMAVLVKSQVVSGT